MTKHAPVVNDATMRERSLRLVSAPDVVVEPERVETMGDLFRSLLCHLDQGGDGLDLRLAALADEYDRVPLPG